MYVAASISLPAMRSVAESDGALVICTTLKTEPLHAVLGTPVLVRLTTYDDTGKVACARVSVLFT